METQKTQLGGRTVLVIGASGKTGRRALEGLLAGGIVPTEVSVLSRRATAHPDLTEKGMQVVVGDLDSTDSLRAALGLGSGGGVGSPADGSRPRAVYIHALSADAASADPAEVERARRLAPLLAEARVSHVIFNSSAGRGCGAGISQMDQKHAMEDIFRTAGLPLTALQATLFMEEFWKKYTRPAVLKGTFAFAMPADKPLQMVSVSDVGRAAAQVLQAPEEFIGQAVQLAGDELTPTQIAAAYGAAQEQHGLPPVRYRRLPAWPFWFLKRDLYRICRFYSTKGYDADVAFCRRRFGLESFASFLAQTRWGDVEAELLS